MKLLLDTHTFRWFINGSEKHSGHARSLIENPANQRLLSIASLWEMAIKASLNRLELQDTFADLVEHQVLGNAISVLPTTPGHLDILKTLPFHHRDPFDRMIVAQSISENTATLSRGSALDAYDIERIWDL
jgi:PIN domain nuclease of toxin-antitoxin system